MIEAATFKPVRLELAELGPVGLDGPDLRCFFQTSWCRDRYTLAGGLDAHHRWPRFLGGPAEPTDAQGLILLCPGHHRRQHALVRAMVEAGSTAVRPVRRFARIEFDTAAYAVGEWVKVDKPRIAGWSAPAAALRAA